MMAKNNKGLNNESKKEIAFDLYMNTDLRQKEIAARVQVSEPTMSKWAKEGLWEELRSAGSITASRITNNLYKKMAELTELNDKIDADELVKIAKTIEYLSNKKATVSHAINVFKEFTSFMFKRNPALAKEFNNYQKEFVEEMING